MTIPQFSKILAQNFQKYSIVPLIKEYIEEIEETNKSWRFDLTIKKDKKHTKRMDYFGIIFIWARNFGVF